MEGWISLKAVPLLLGTFVSRFKLELMYVSLIVNIKLSLTLSMVFACAAAIVHKNHFFLKLKSKY